MIKLALKCFCLVWYSKVSNSCLGKNYNAKVSIANRLSIAVVFVIFAVEFMNTTANLTKMTAINDNAQKKIFISRKFESFRAKKFLNFFKMFFKKKFNFFFKTNFGNVK